MSCRPAKNIPWFWFSGRVIVTPKAKRKSLPSHGLGHSGRARNLWDMSHQKQKEKNKNKQTKKNKLEFWDWRTAAWRIGRICSRPGQDLGIWGLCIIEAWKSILTYLSLCFIFIGPFVFVFWPHLQHVEVPCPGTKLEPQQQPRQLQWQCQILNPLCQKDLLIGPYKWMLWGND